jgi:hypothetical protein
MFGLTKMVRDIRDARPDGGSGEPDATIFLYGATAALPGSHIASSGNSTSSPNSTNMIK